MRSIFQSLVQLLPLTLAITPVLSLPTTSQSYVKQIYQWPIGSWAENIAARENGQLLVTFLNAAQLWALDPLKKNPEPILLHTFTGSNALLGITETEKDVFAVISGNFDLDAGSDGNGTYIVWKVDLRNKEAKVTKITAIPEGGLLNGMALLNSPSEVLISDSANGLVWKLNVNTGKYSIVIDDPLFKKADSSTFLPGINGIRLYPAAKIQGSHSIEKQGATKEKTLYFANYDAHLFGRVTISPSGSALRPAIKISEPVGAQAAYDDFAVDRYGKSWVTMGPQNTVDLIPVVGKESVVAGNLNSTELAEPTAAAFGRLSVDCEILYVVTGGGNAAPINGTAIVGAQVVAIDTRRFR